MDDSSFIRKQIKFMYGKYLNEIKEKKYIYESFEKDDIHINDILNNNYTTNERNNVFINIIKQYWTKSTDKYILKANWGDNTHYDRFILTYNRLFDKNSQVIFPLYGYQNPSSISINDTTPFKNKSNKLIWRGGSTGDEEIEKNIRYHVVSKNINKSNEIDVGFSHFCQSVYENNKKSFSNLLKNNVSREEQLNYKFILNLEGNDVASSFPWVLASNCCPLHNYPFKYESYIFGKELIPYVHFVPIKNDGSDLQSQLKWCFENMDKCEEIAYNGKKYMEQYLDVNLYRQIIKIFIHLYPIKTK